MRFGVRLAVGAIVAVRFASAAFGQFDFSTSGKTPPGGGPGGGAGIVSLTATLRPAGANAAQLEIVASIQAGYHIYSITQPPGGPVPTSITVDPAPQCRVAGPFVADPKPESKREPLFDNMVVETHHGVVTWRAPVELVKDADIRSIVLRGRVKAQPCDASGCIPPTQFEFQTVLGEPIAGAVKPNVMNSGPAIGPAEAAPPPDTQAEIRDYSFYWAVLLGFLGGLILNVMPCVLPVIGLKVMAFVEQSHHDRKQAFLLNLWYSLGLTVVFLALALLFLTAGLGWGEQFTKPWFTITCAAVVFSLGLCFLGVWEIPIPGFAGGTVANQLASKEGFWGAFSKGVLGTILAIPCGAPMLGLALAWVREHPQPVNVLAIYMSAALGMASPYLMIGAFPESVRWLPKPGAWMDTFRQVLGFVLLIVVAYLLTCLDFVSVVPTFVLLVGVWIGCWWVARTPLTAEIDMRLRAWGEGVLVVGAAWLIAFLGLSEIMPSNAPWWLSFESIESRMTRDLREKVDLEVSRRLEKLSKESGDSGASIADLLAEQSARANLKDYELPWRPFTRSAFDRLRSEKKTLLVDFTANWCLTCKFFKSTVLNTVEVRQAVDENRVVTLKADWTDGDPEVSAMLNELGSKQVPVVAIYSAKSPKPIAVFFGGYTKQQVLDALRQAGPSE